MFLFEINERMADFLWLYWSWFSFLGLLFCVVIAYNDLVVHWKFNKISSYVIMLVGTSMFSVTLTWVYAILAITLIDIPIFSGANSNSEIQKVYDQSIRGGYAPREGKRKKQIQKFNSLSTQEQEKYLSSIPDMSEMKMNSKVFYLVTAGIPIIISILIKILMRY